MQNRLVSYCIFSYQQEDYIKQTILGALNQTYSPLEIIISDDCSSDATFSVIKEIVREYKGPHKIILNRNEKNLGIGAHFSKVAYDIANGDYIITIGGDDVSKSNHVFDAVQYLEKHPDSAMVDFNATFIDQDGNLLKENILGFEKKSFTLDDFIKNKKISWFAPGRIIRKETIVTFPQLASSCPTEDTIVAAFFSYLSTMVTDMLILKLTLGVLSGLGSYLFMSSILKIDELKEVKILLAKIHR